MLMTGTLDFSGGHYTFLDCSPRPPLHRRELHPIGLGVGEWRFCKSLSSMLRRWIVVQLAWTRSLSCR